MTEKPKRIQRKRVKGWRKPGGTVIVTRPGRWGNPFKVVSLESGDSSVVYWRVERDGAKVSSHLFMTRAQASRYAVELYRQYVERHMTGDIGLIHFRRIEQLLRGKDLACWCKLDEPCHADILLELANR
jgi:hypothetical protein